MASSPPAHPTTSTTQQQSEGGGGGGRQFFRSLEGGGLLAFVTCPGTLRGCDPGLKREQDILCCIRDHQRELQLVGLQELGNSMLASGS